MLLTLPSVRPSAAQAHDYAEMARATQTDYFNPSIQYVYCHKTYEICEIIGIVNSVSLNMVTQCHRHYIRGRQHCGGVAVVRALQKKVRYSYL